MLSGKRTRSPTARPSHSSASTASGCSTRCQPAKHSVLRRSSLRTSLPHIRQGRNQMAPTPMICAPMKSDSQPLA